MLQPKMLRCAKCKEEKPDEAFRPYCKSHCIACRRASSLKWAAENKERKNSQSLRGSKKKLKERRVFIDSLKSVPCGDCEQEYPPYVMDFDHVPERGKKVGPIATMWSYGEKSLLAEVAKCDVICSNCHRIRTHKRKIEKLLVV